MWCGAAAFPVHVRGGMFWYRRYLAMLNWRPVDDDELREIEQL
jgi:hypothetical protein